MMFWKESLYHWIASSVSERCLESTAIGQIRGLVKKPIETQTIWIQRVGSKFTSKFAKLVFNIFGHTHIKDALHQSFNRKQVGVNVLQISHCLLMSISGLFSTSHRCGMNLAIARAGPMLLLKILKNPSRQCAESLQSGPTQLLLLPKCGVFPDQPVVLPVEALAVRALTRLFWHQRPITQSPS